MPFNQPALRRALWRRPKRPVMVKFALAARPYQKETAPAPPPPRAGCARIPKNGASSFGAAAPAMGIVSPQEMSAWARRCRFPARRTSDLRSRPGRVSVAN